MTGPPAPAPEITIPPLARMLIGDFAQKGLTILATAAAGAGLIATSQEAQIIADGVAILLFIASCAWTLGDAWLRRALFQAALAAPAFPPAHPPSTPRKENSTMTLDDITASVKAAAARLESEVASFLTAHPEIEAAALQGANQTVNDLKAIAETKIDSLATKDAPMVAPEVIALLPEALGYLQGVVQTKLDQIVAARAALAPAGS